MRWITGLLVATTLAKKPSLTDQPAAEPAPAPVSPIERKLDNPKGYAIKMLATCTPTGKDLVGRNQVAPNEYTYSLYGSGGLAVGQSMNVGPPEDFMKAVQGDRPIDILKTLPIGVFEVARSYAHRTGYQALQDAGGTVSFDKTYRNLYLGMDKQILVTDGLRFSTRAIGPSIPNELRFGRWRFVDEQQGSEEGIYGLVDRLVGTSVEARVSVDLLNCGWEDAGLSVGNWLDLFSSVETSLFAAQEMRFYVLSYLRFAKDNEATVYQAALDNKPLMQAIAEVHQRTMALEVEYAQKAQALTAKLTEKGMNATFSEQSIRIGEDGRNRYTDQRTRVSAALAAPGLNEIAEAVNARSK